MRDSTCPHEAYVSPQKRRMRYKTRHRHAPVRGQKGSRKGDIWKGQESMKGPVPREQTHRELGLAVSRGPAGRRWYDNEGGAGFVKAPNYKDWENEKNEEMSESEIKAVSWDHRDRNAPWEKVKNAALPWGGWRRAKSVLRTKTKPNARLCGKESRKWGRKKKAWKTARWAEGPVTGASFKTWLGGNCLLSRLLVNRGAQVILRTLRHCVLQRPRS